MPGEAFAAPVDMDRSQEAVTKPGFNAITDDPFYDGVTLQRDATSIDECRGSDALPSLYGSIHEEA